MATGETRKPAKNRREIHRTKVRIDLNILREVVGELELKWEMLGAMRGKEATKEQRSAFSKYNTLRSFLSKYDSGQDDIVLDVSGGVSGASARVYYFPSVTSLTKEFRKSIVPLNNDTVFLFFDLKACEFYLNCLFCNELEAVSHYLRGEDIYMYYKDLFPAGTERNIIKRSLIANMYGTTAYRIALDCGITETQSQRILDTIALKLPSMTRNKNNVILQARRNGFYSCPSFDWETKTFDTSRLIEVYNWRKNNEEFKPLLALSAYVQSAAGNWMQQFIEHLEERTSGTILSVFDSVLVEVKKDKIDVAKRFIDRNIKPFLTDEVAVGKTFYEVYAKESV